MRLWKSKKRKLFEAAVEAHRRGRFKEAVLQFETLHDQVRGEDSELECIYLWLADCYRELQHFETAIEYCEQAIRISGRSQDSLQAWRSCVYCSAVDAFNQERFVDAVAKFKSLLELSDVSETNLRSSFLWIGLCFQLLGEYENAILAFEKALTLFPDLMPAKAYLAYVLATAPQPELRSGERAEVLAGEICAETDWTDWEKLTLLATAEAELGRFHDAVVTYERAMDLMPSEERDKREETLAQLRSRQPIRCNPEYDKSRLVKRPLGSTST